MKALSSLPLLCVFLMVCSCTGNRVQKDFYPGNRPRYSIALDKEGRKEGPETWWHPSGQKKYETVNRAGVRDGKFMAWYPNGKTWYEGFEFGGKPESTLTYWYPTGMMKSRALFRDGIQLERRDYDEQGNLILRPDPAVQKAGGPADADSGARSESEGLRKASLAAWALRVRRTVEGYWVLPKQFEQDRPYRTVARIKVAKNGKIMGVTWVEKSPSAAFNDLARQTFKRIKRLPPFPPLVSDPTLEVQYEFISLGRQVPRKKLEARESPVE